VGALNALEGLFGCIGHDSLTHSPAAGEVSAVIIDQFLMKLTGFLLLLCGWFIVLSAVALLPSGLSQVSFVLAALSVEALGLALVFRAHLSPNRGT
jgi:hypothetical protein